MYIFICISDTYITNIFSEIKMFYNYYNNKIDFLLCFYLLKIYKMSYALIHIQVYLSEEDDYHKVAFKCFNSLDILKKHIQSLSYFESYKNFDFVDTMISNKTHVSIKKSYNVHHFFIVSTEEEFSFDLDSLSINSLESVDHSIELDLEGYKDIIKAWNKGVYSNDIYHMILDWINGNIDLCDITKRKYLKKVLTRMGSNDSSNDIVEDFIDENILDLQYTSNSDSE